MQIYLYLFYWLKGKWTDRIKGKKKLNLEIMVNATQFENLINKILKIIYIYINILTFDHDMSLLR